ncbi:hypothetical protein GQ600_6549 [Phytophthora cactorum]|nr:hypothetical protein GQ600_6549 [Phytophthora cactorum]
MSRWFQATYHSWEDFDAALAKFSQSTYQIFRKRTSSSFKTRNEQLETRHNAARSRKSREKIPLLPTQYTAYAKTLLCTHGFERKTKSSGKRKHKFSRSRFRCGGQRSHARGPCVFRHYPENRCDESYSLLANVDEMRKSGAKTKGILFI